MQKIDNKLYEICLKKVGEKIDSYYLSNSNISINKKSILDVVGIINDGIHENLLNEISEFTSSRKSLAISLTDLFSIDNATLAFLVHEALSTHIFGIKDYTYAHEDHKTVFPKVEGKDHAEWSHGSQVISPHVDDAYEPVDVDMLSLTTCRDLTSTPTLVVSCEELLFTLSTQDYEFISNQKGIFVSGKNVVGVKLKQIKSIIERGPDGEITGYNLDFRIDKDVGKRSYMENQKFEYIIDQLRANINECPCAETGSRTGTFVIFNNKFAMHSRKPIPNKKALTDNINQTHRLLFRSRGQKTIYPNLSYM
jgi:hypothetical protein